MNTDIVTRDTMIFGSFDREKYMGGVRKCNNLSCFTLEKLVAKDFADPKEAQNDSPTIQEFIKFMKTYKGYTAHGYVVIDTRDDYRVAVEGIDKGGDAESIEELKDFIKLCRWADSLDVDTMYCWYD